MAGCELKATEASEVNTCLITVQLPPIKNVTCVCDGNDDKLHTVFAYDDFTVYIIVRLSLFLLLLLLLLLK